MKTKAQDRLAHCTELMTDNDIDVLLLTKPSNMFYLTGDGRLCSFVMVTNKGEVAMGVPSTDLNDVKSSASYDKIVGFEDEIGMIHAIAHFFADFGITSGKVGLEFTFLTQSMMSMLTHPHAKPEGLEISDATSIMSELRIVKGSDEINAIKNSAKVAMIAMEAAMEAVKPGITEIDVAAAAEFAMRQAGAEGFWRSYVSSGARTNIAHGLPVQRIIHDGDLVMIDLHPIVENYSADICRTVVAGAASSNQREVYDLFVRAQQETIGGIRPGASVAELESMLHTTFKNAGHGEHIFGPPIHGVGIEFEEAPLPPGHAFFHGEKPPLPLVPGNVIAVGNCGLYTGPWGVRVEDTVLVTDDGHEVLTDVERSLFAHA